MINHLRVAPARLGAALFVSAFFGVTAGASANPTPAPLAAAVPAGHYHLDKSHASLELRVSHLGFSNYTTRFSRFDSSLTFDPKNLTATKLLTTVDASSFEMDAAPAMCLTMVKGPQFLDVSKFANIVFRSESIRMTGPASFELTGTLNMHGVTHPLVLTGSYNGGYPGMPNLDPHARIGFSAHGSLKRSDYGMSNGVPAAGSTMGVGDAIEISIEVEFSGPALADTAAAK